MRLLVLANSTVWAGAEIFLWRLCRELCALGFPVVVACPPEGSLADRFQQLPLSGVYRQEMGDHSARTRGVVGSLAMLDPRARQRYSRLLERMRKDHGCDTVLCQYPREQALATRIAKSMGYRVVWIIHSKQHYLANRIVVNPMLRRAIQGAEPALVISDATKTALIGSGFPSGPMRLLSAGFDAPSVPLHIQLVQHNGRRKIGIVSRLLRLKGVQDTLFACPGVLKSFPDLEILVAGDGRYRSALERMARKLGIGRSVHFLGFVDNTMELYRQIDVLVHATFDPGESMPANILEAAAMGVPAIATRWAGIPEIVRDGQTGLLVPPHDVDSIRDALLRILRDRAFATRLGENARAFVTGHFSMTAVARDFLQALHESSAASVSRPGSPESHN